MQHTIAEEISMMQDEDKWPHWPILPLVNRTGNSRPECGFLFVSSGPTVFIGNMWDPKFDNPKKYNSYQEIVDDGWRID